MKHSILCRNFTLTDSITSYVERKAWYTLTRYKDHIKEVEITLAADNGKSKANNCQISVTFYQGKPIFLTEKQTDLYKAIDKAFCRLGKKIIRSVDNKDTLAKKSIFKPELGMFNMKLTGGYYHE